MIIQADHVIYVDCGFRFLNSVIIKIHDTELRGQEEASYMHELFTCMYHCTEILQTLYIL